MDQRTLKRNFKKIMNVMKIKTYWDLWDAAKVILRGQFIALNAYIREVDEPEVNNLTSHFKKLGVDWQSKKKDLSYQEWRMSLLILQISRDDKGILLIILHTQIWQLKQNRANFWETPITITYSVWNISFE